MLGVLVDKDRNAKSVTFHLDANKCPIMHNSGEMEKYASDIYIHNNKTIRVSSWCDKDEGFQYDNVFPHKLPGAFNNVLHMTPILFCTEIMITTEESCEQDSNSFIQGEFVSMDLDLFSTVWHNTIKKMTDNNKMSVYSDEYVLVDDDNNTTNAVIDDDNDSVESIDLSDGSDSNECDTDGLDDSKGLDD